MTQTRASHPQPSTEHLLPHQRATGPVRVGLLGYGVVGREVAAMLTSSAAELAQRVGAPLELVAIAVRDVDKAKAHANATGLGEQVVPLLTDDAAGLVSGRVAGRLDVVIEVMGGLEPAASLITQAIAAGSSVVTANKALLAHDGPAIFRAAEQAGVDVYYEAAVAGAIPLLRPLRESLVGDQVHTVMGIVNGTTNYILTCMDEQGMNYEQALELAQQAGYAEADPSADVQGQDAAAKAAILSTLAFHSPVSVQQVACEGITKLGARDIAHAQERDSVIKLLAVAQRVPVDGETGRPQSAQPQPGQQQSGQRHGISVMVHPVMVPRQHPLAGVRHAYNAVFVQADAAGDLMFYGQGAGGVPTASAVLGDVVSLARHRVNRSRGPVHSAYAGLPIVPANQSRSAFHVHVQVHDRPGALAAVAQVFADHEVSLATVRQSLTPAGAPASGAGQPEDAQLVMVTHGARQADVQETIKALAQLDVVIAVHNLIRVIE